MWSARTILLGLYTFMMDSNEQQTFGSITTTAQVKKQFAMESLEFNVRNPTFCELFPELVELYEERKKSAPSPPLAPLTTSVDPEKAQQASWTVIVGILAAVVAFTWALLSLSI